MTSQCSGQFGLSDVSSWVMWDVLGCSRVFWRDLDCSGVYWSLRKCLETFGNGILKLLIFDVTTVGFRHDHLWIPLVTVSCSGSSQVPCRIGTLEQHYLASNPDCVNGVSYSNPDRLNGLTD